MNIYVANVNFRATDDDLNKLFASFGEVVSAKIVKEKENPERSRGFGFVEMKYADEAAVAITALDGYEFMERNLKVSEANPPKNKGNGERGGSIRM